LTRDGGGRKLEQRPEREKRMPKIKHIAISAKDADATARFFTEVFGMKEVGRFDGHGARGYYLSDGELNLAILNFKNDAVAGIERGKDWYGLHHIGFQVESLDEIHQKLASAGSQPRDDVNAALGVGRGQRQESNVEVKYAGPDGVMIDVSETGWSGTARSLDQEASKERTAELA
jgi:catechol 2,3-dioxygenase-like lactoylglutathione lyase family enzyme